MGLLINFLLFVSLSTVIGLGSAWHFIERGGILATETSGPWRSWSLAGNPSADPYTKAHFARSGQLPMTSTAARYFTATKDQGGRSLRADCDYVVEGRPLAALWWSIALYRSKGGLFKNKAQRYAFNSTNIFMRDNGSFQIWIAPQARPENWLPVEGDGYFKLMLRIYRPERPDSVATDAEGKGLLPTIKRLACR